MHINIPQSRDVPVYDEYNNHIGNISPPDKLGTFNLGSKKWKVEKFSERKITVRQIYNTNIIPSFHNNAHGYFHKYLPEQIRDCVDYKQLLK